MSLRPWLHCNACGEQLSDTKNDWFISHCRHFACIGCYREHDGEACPSCKRSTEFCTLNKRDSLDTVPTDVITYVIKDPRAVIEEALDVYSFHREQALHLQKFHNLRVSQLEEHNAALLEKVRQQKSENTALKLELKHMREALEKERALARATDAVRPNTASRPPTRSAAAVSARGGQRRPKSRHFSLRAARPASTFTLAAAGPPPTPSLGQSTRPASTATYQQRSHPSFSHQRTSRPTRPASSQSGPRGTQIRGTVSRPHSAAGSIGSARRTATPTERSSHFPRT